jgi:hypothetical protein
MEYIIKYEIAVQCSPDDWRMEWKEKIVDENTTIGEIVEWFKQKEKLGHRLPKFFPEMRLTKPDLV